MIWSEIRKEYPDQWLIVEALEAHTSCDSRRVLDQLSVIEICKDGWHSMQRYRHFHRTYPQREFYFMHTSRKEPEIHEQSWHGIRRGHAAEAEG